MFPPLAAKLAEFDRQVRLQKGPAWAIYADAQRAIGRGSAIAGEPAFPLFMPLGDVMTKVIAFLRWHYNVELALDALGKATLDGILFDVMQHFASL